MLLQVGRYLWPPVSRYIVRGCDTHALARADAARLERTVLEGADANRHVDALFDQTDEAVANLQIQLHLRVTIQKRLHARQQVRASEERRTGYAQHTARHLLAADV